MNARPPIRAPPIPQAQQARQPAADPLHRWGFHQSTLDFINVTSFVDGSLQLPPAPTSSLHPAFNKAELMLAGLQAAMQQQPACNSRAGEPLWALSSRFEHVAMQKAIR